MDATVLAAREHANLVAAFTVIAGATPDGLVRRADGVACLLSGLPGPQFNQVVVEDDAAAPEAVAAAVAQARARPAPFAVNLRVGPDDRLLPLMADLGLVRISAEPWMPAMALSPLPATPPRPVPGHDIRRVTDAAGIADHVRVAAAAFEIPADLMGAIVTPTVVRLPGFAAYVGYADGEPVSTGIGVRTGRTIGVYNVSVLPAARRRGFGEAMTVRIAADGAADGCDVAILQSSAMGRPLYERLGYRPVVDYMGYVRATGD